MQDLRVCLKSADKELKEVRDEKKEEKRSYDTKITNYMQKARISNYVIFLFFLREGVDEYDWWL